MREEIAEPRRAKEAGELKVSEVEARAKQGEEARKRGEDVARVSAERGGICPSTSSYPALA